MRWRIRTLMLIVMIAALVAALFVQQVRISRLQTDAQLEVARARAEAAQARAGETAAAQTARTLQQILGSESRRAASVKTDPLGEGAAR